MGSTGDQRNPERSRHVGSRPAQHEHPDVDQQEGEQGADVHQLDDLPERDESGQDGDQDPEADGQAGGGAEPRVDMGQPPGEHPVSAHREEDPGLAVHDDQHHGGDRHQRAGGQDAAGPGKPGAFPQGRGQRCVAAGQRLIGATPTAAIETRT